MSKNYESKIPEAKKALKAAEEKALEACGVAGQSWIIPLTPVGKYPDGSGRVGGNLRNSNGYKVDTNEKSVTFYNTAEYAPYVEFGTSKQKAQSFLRKAIEGNISRLKNLFSEMLRL